MTRREKVIGIGLGGTLGGLALVWAVRWALVDPFFTMRDDIRKATEMRLSLTKQRAQLQSVETEWQKLAARTLATDPRVAQQQFRENVVQLLERNGLMDDPTAKDTKMSPGTLTVDKNGFVEVPLTIRTTGTLKEVVNFLIDLYKQDYIKRVDKVSLSADSSVINTFTSAARVNPNPPAGPRGRKPPPGRKEPTLEPDGPDLTVVLQVTTLVLPKVQKIEARAAEEIKTLEEGGPLRHDLGDYAAIYDRSLFRPYQKAPEVVVHDPNTPTTLPEKKEQPHVEPVAVRPDADKFYLVGVDAWNGQLRAFVLDERNKDNAVARYQLDAPIDDGVLRLIHPKGLVVRTRTPDGRPQDWFYPLGKSFAERKPLTEEEFPEVVEELRQEFQEVPADSGAKDRPG